MPSPLAPAPRTSPSLRHVLLNPSPPLIRRWCVLHRKRPLRTNRCAVLLVLVVLGMLIISPVVTDDAVVFVIIAIIRHQVRMALVMPGAPRRRRPRPQTLPYTHKARPLATALAVGVRIEVSLLGGPAVADVAGAEVDGGGNRCFGWRLQLCDHRRGPSMEVGAWSLLLIVEGCGAYANLLGPRARVWDDLPGCGRVLGIVPVSAEGRTRMSAYGGGTCCDTCTRDIQIQMDLVNMIVFIAAGSFLRMGVRESRHGDVSTVCGGLVYSVVER